MAANQHKKKVSERQTTEGNHKPEKLWHERLFNCLNLCDISLHDLNEMIARLRLNGKKH